MANTDRNQVAHADHPAHASSATGDRAAVGCEADAFFRRSLGDLGTIAQTMVERARLNLATFVAGEPLTDEAIRVLGDCRQDEARFREITVTVVVTGAILSGRWPEDGEAEARARCADDDGLMAFMDAMEKVPIGFVDAQNDPEGEARH